MSFQRLHSDDPDLPIEGKVEVELPVERVWETFADVERWHEWNPCIWRSRVSGGELAEGATLRWAFNPIRRAYLYKLPATARIVECDPCRIVTWEASLLGFHAHHSYTFETVGPDRSRFGSWEVAEGPGYRRLRSFWLAHFRFVCEESLAGASGLAGRDPRPVRR